MSIFYWKVKLYPWPTVPLIKHFMCQIEHRGGIKQNSENLVLKTRNLKFGVLLKSGKSREYEEGITTQ